MLTNKKTCELAVHFNCTKHEISEISFIVIEKITSQGDAAHIDRLLLTLYAFVNCCATCLLRSWAPLEYSAISFFFIIIFFTALFKGPALGPCCVSHYDHSDILRPSAGNSLRLACCVTFDTCFYLNYCN